MDVIDVIYKEIKDSGVSITYVAKKSKMTTDTLSKCLLRKRNLRADEFIRVVRALKLDINKFISADEAS